MSNQEHQSGSSAEPATGAAPTGADATAYEFVRRLALEISTGEVELSGFPQVALQVQRVLADDNADSVRVVRVVGAEPVLASRILRMANSAALNPAGVRIGDLRGAVSRLGFDALRAAALGFALAQVRASAHSGDIEQALKELWERSIALAAAALVIARNTRRASPDTAMLCGVVSGVGKLYILTRSREFPAVQRDSTAYQIIVRDWHATLAHALLQHWSLPEEIVTAVQNYEAPVSDLSARPSLTDVLSAAQVLAGFSGDPELLAPVVESHPAIQRLELDVGTCKWMLGAAAEELASLRDALGS